MENLSKEDQKLHKKFVSDGKNRKEITRRLLAMIPQIEEREIHIKKGFETIYEYGVIYAGLSHYAIEQARRIYNKVKNISVCANLIEELGINKAECVACVLNTENAETLIKVAKNLSFRSLKTLTDEIKEKEFGDDFVKAVIKKMSVELDVESQKAFYRVKKVLKLEGSDKVVMGKILVKVEKFLNKGLSAKKNKSPDVRTFSSSTLYAEKKRVNERSGGTCEYPGCVKAIDECHHEDGRSITKSHKGLRGYCKEHHDIMHSGCIITSYGDWRLNLINPERNILPEYLEINEKRQMARRRYFDSKAVP